MLAVPSLRELYAGICLTTEEKAWKNLSQGSVFQNKLQIIPQYETLLCNIAD